jgi:ABC-type phosphate/phosphonate transport system permease subunit
MKSLKMNFLAVLVAIVFQFVLGFLWYGPLFGEPWMEMVGLDAATVEANPPGAGIWISNVISAALAMLVLAWLFVKLDVRTLLKGVWIGFMLGFAFMLMPVMISGMYADHPYWLAWITGGNTVVGLMIGGAVLGSWKSYKE